MTPTPGPSPAPPEAAGQENGAQLRRDSAWTTLTNYLIVSGLLTCAVIGVVQLGWQIAPTWNASYIPVLCFFIALEAAYMTRYLRHHKPPVPWYVLRGVEVVAIFLLLRSLLGVWRGPQPERAFNPFYGEMDNELFVLAVIALLTWIAGWLFTSDLLDLEPIDPTLDRELIKDLAETRVNARQSLITRALIIGVALAFLAGLTNIYLHESDQAAPAASFGLWPVLAYFLLALLLFSRTRLALLRVGWLWERLPVGRGVGSRWITYTLVILIGAALVAVLLPTHYSLGLLGTLGYILSFIITLVQALVYLMVSLLYALWSLFMPGLPRQPPPQPQALPPSASGTLNVAPPTLSEFAQSLIFWIVFFVITGYVLVQFLRRHPEVGEALKRLPGMGLLARAWRKVRAWLGGLGQQLEDLREARRRARQPAPPRSDRTVRPFINLRKLSPRQQVQFFYLAMLRRGGEKGYARRSTQTPYEYAGTLKSQLPDVEEAVTAMTDEFVEARYSRHEITLDHVGLVRRYWEHIKRALRR